MTGVWDMEPWLVREERSPGADRAVWSEGDLFFSVLEPGAGGHRGSKTRTGVSGREETQDGRAPPDPLVEEGRP